MKTTCCSDKCERKFECAKHCINNEGISVCEDFYSFGSGTMTENGCEIKHWCGSLGNWGMYQCVGSEEVQVIHGNLTNAWADYMDAKHLKT